MTTNSLASSLEIVFSGRGRTKKFSRGVVSLYGVAELCCNRCLGPQAYRRLQGFIPS